MQAKPGCLKIAGVGCGGLIGIFLLLSAAAFIFQAMRSPEEKAAEAAKEAAVAAAKVEAQQKAEAAAQQAASQAAAQSAEQAEKAIAAFDRYIATLESPLVQGVRYDMDGTKRQEAIITVSNLWHIRAYQIRLQDAQTLWDLWAKASTVDEIDSARISIVDLRGNEVGGSRILAGSLIWVQE